MVPSLRVALRGTSAFLLVVLISRVHQPRVTGQEAKDPYGLSKHCRVLSGHDGVVHAVAFSPDGSTLASGGADGFLRFWEVPSGKGKGQIQAHLGSVYCVAYSPNSKTIASVGTDDVVEGDPRRGKATVKLGGHAVRTWDSSTGQKVQTLEGHADRVAAVAFSPDGKVLATGSYDRTVRLWDPDSGRELAQLRGHQGRVTALAFSPDGKYLASGALLLWMLRGMDLSHCDQVHVWDLTARKLARRLSVRASHVSYSPTARQLAVGGEYPEMIQFPEGGVGINGDNSVHLVDPLRDRECFKARGRGQFIVFTPDGKLFATGQGTKAHHAEGNIIGPGANVPYDPSLRLWESQTCKPLLTLPQEYPGPVAFTPDGKHLATPIRGNNVQLWNLEATLLEWAASSTDPGRDDLDVLWGHLGHEDPAIAYKALWRMIPAREKAVAFLRRHLRPVPAEMGQRFQELVADLQDTGFAIRQAAAQELRRRFGSFEPGLRQALAGAQNLELRMHLESILGELEREDLKPADLRESRAVQLLENLGTRQEQQLLRELAKGAPGASLTSDAQAAVTRLDRLRR